MRIRIEILTSKLQIDVDPESVPDLAYQFYVDQDPDPDPAFYLMRIQVTIKTRIHVDPDPKTSADPYSHILTLRSVSVVLLTSGFPYYILKKS
jgi:hypothetical protein